MLPIFFHEDIIDESIRNEITSSPLGFALQDFKTFLNISFYIGNIY